MVKKVRPSQLPNLTRLEQQVGWLENLALQGNAKAVVEFLAQVVPTFQPISLDLPVPAWTHRKVRSVH
jgi:hypothetical protein